MCNDKAAAQGSQTWAISNILCWCEASSSSKATALQTFFSLKTTLTSMPVVRHKLVDMRHVYSYISFGHKFHVHALLWWLFLFLFLERPVGELLHQTIALAKICHVETDLWHEDQMITFSFWHHLRVCFLWNIHTGTFIVTIHIGQLHGLTVLGFPNSRSLPRTPWISWRSSCSRMSLGLGQILDFWAPFDALTFLLNMWFLVGPGISRLNNCYTKLGFRHRVYYFSFKLQNNSWWLVDQKE